MIKISQLYIQNVGPFEGETFDFSVEEGHPDIHIFTGINGCGKTTILHSLAASFDHFEEEHHRAEHKSNLLYKRFHSSFSTRTWETQPKSKIQTLLTTKKNEFHEETSAYWCGICGNIHMFYDRINGKLDDNYQVNSEMNHLQHTPQFYPLSKYKNAAKKKELKDDEFYFAAFGYSGYRLIESAQIKHVNTEKDNPLSLALEFVKKNDESGDISNWIASSYSKAAIEETEGNKELAIKLRGALDCLRNGINELTEGEFTFKVKTNPWQVVLVYYDKELEFDVLPDGLRSILSWMGDLLMRLDSIPWKNKNIPVNEQHIILFLDEIEVHLHPKWQYQILPLTRKIFPNAQIFLTTHSPFIINSIDNAKIHKLKLENGVSKVHETRLSETGDSYNYVYEHILDTKNKFAAATEKKIAEFDKIDAEIVRGDFRNEEKFKELVGELVEEGEEVITMISSKLYRLKRVIGKDYLNGKN